MNARGDVLTALDEEKVRIAADDLIARGIRHSAVALLHSYANPAHEQRIAEILRAAGFDHVTLSSEIAAFTKILPRAQRRRECLSHRPRGCVPRRRRRASSFVI